MQLSTCNALTKLTVDVIPQWLASKKSLVVHRHMMETHGTLDCGKRNVDRRMGHPIHGLSQRL